MSSARLLIVPRGHVTLFGGAVADAMAARTRFLRLTLQRDGTMSYAEFVAAIVAVANEGSVENLTFAHEVVRAWDSAYSANECAVLTLLVPVTMKAAA